MFSGHQPMLILAALANEDRSALEVIEAVKKSAQVKLTVSGIYSQLHRLERQGLIKGREQEVDGDRRGGRPRRVYKITGEGRRVLDQVERVREWGVTNG